MSDIRRYLPSTYAVITCFIASILIISISNFSFLITFLGFSQERLFITSSLSPVWSRATSGFDNLSFTPATSVLLFWIVVGVIVLGLINAIQGTLASASFDLEVSSKKFRRPASFSLWSFWREVLVTFTLHALGFVLLLTALWLMLFLTLPFAVICVHVFVAAPLNPLNVAYLLSGLIAEWLNLSLMVIFFKLLVRPPAKSSH